MGELEKLIDKSALADSSDFSEEAKTARTLAAELLAQGENTKAAQIAIDCAKSGEFVRGEWP
jgi:hypothetical protein